MPDINPGSVSVIIPSYNRAATLPRAIDSVLAQSHAADEILIIDDGSSDNTKQLIHSRYPDALAGNLRYIYQDNAGVSAARNAGIKASSGQWLAFLDSDDVWQADKLSTQLTALQQHPEIQICHGNEIWVRNGKRVNQMNKHRKYGGMIFKHALPLCVISPSAVIIARRLFEQLGLFDETLPACEDYDLWLRICAEHEVLFIDQPLITKHGGHQDQLSRKYWGMDRFRIRALHKIIDHGTLSTEDRQAAIDMLIHKSKIYIKGAQKHGRDEDVQKYQQLINLFQPS